MQEEEEEVEVEVRRQREEAQHAGLKVGSDSISR